MTTILGGVTLDHDLIWTDRHLYPDLIAQTYTAIDGSEIVFERQRGPHFPITLEATDETGWLRGITIDAIREFSGKKGTVYELSMGGRSYVVRFRNEVENGAIQMRYRVVTTTPDDDTWYVGKINLMCVG